VVVKLNSMVSKMEWRKRRRGDIDLMGDLNRLADASFQLYPSVGGWPSAAYGMVAQPDRRRCGSIAGGGQCPWVVRFGPYGCWAGGRWKQRENNWAAQGVLDRIEGWAAEVFSPFITFEFKIQRLK
jgi:hypothetical protein